jgi:hypothetical protein
VGGQDGGVLAQGCGILAELSDLGELFGEVASRFVHRDGGDLVGNRIGDE